MLKNILQIVDADVTMGPVMVHNEDYQIVQEVLEGNIDRYASLVNKYQARAIRLAFSILGNYEDAKDVSQEAFVSAYCSLNQFKGKASFYTWLYRIVVNKCKDFFKRRKLKVFNISLGSKLELDSGDGILFEIEDTSANPSDKLENLEIAKLISTTLKQLSVKQRTAFVLHHLQRLSLQEVAEIMQCRMGTVKSHLFRATEQLRHYLEPLMKQEETS